MPDRSLLLLSVLATLVACRAPARAGNAPPPGGEELKLTAEEPLLVDGRTGEIVARGQARVEFGDWTLRADEVRMNRNTGEAQASGHVLATRPGLRLLARTARYLRESGHLEVEDFRFGRPPYYAAGRRGYGTAEHMTFEDVTLYYGEPGKLTPRASVRLLVVDRKGERLEADGLRISVGSIPVLALSGLVRPLAGPRVIWETRAGYDNELGLQAGAGVYFPVAEGFNPGGSLDVFTNRGVMIGPGARYELERDGGTIRGAVDFGYIHDSGDRGTDVLGRPIGADRTFWSWRHQQRGADRWTLNGELNGWHDSAVLRDFREDAFDRNQEPDTFLEGSLYGSDFILSAFTRLRPNDFQPVAERLPEVRFDLLPIPVARTGALFELQAGAAVLREKSLEGEPEMRSDRFDVYAGLSRTLAPARGLTLTPVAGGRLTHYGRAEGGRDSYTRWLGEVGFDARLRASRVKDLKRPLFGIDGFRHIVEPSIQYRYVPRADRGRRFIPAIDRPAFLTQLQPLGLADRRDIDDLGEIHAVRFGLTNLVQTRREGYGSRQVLSFSLASDLFLWDQPQGRNWSDVHAEIRLTPADWLDGWLFVRTDPEKLSLRELNMRLTLVDGEAWSVGVDTDYLVGDLEQYEVFGRYELNEAYRAFGSVRYDARERRFNEITVGVDTQIAQNWIVSTGVTFRDGPRRESSLSVRLNLRFLAF